MKNIRIVLAVLFLFLTAETYAMTVSFFVGSVRISRKGEAVTAEVDRAIMAGDIIETGKGGVCILSLKDGSKIEIKEKSRIKIGNPATSDSDSITVISGLVKGKYKKIAKGDRRVYTPTTVCSVRGTEFSIGVSDAADSRVDLKKGRVELRNPYGKTALTEDSSASIDLGKGPEKREDADDSMKSWKKSKDRELEENPKEKSDRLKNYILNFNKRSSNAMTDISSAREKMKSGISTKEDAKKGMVKADRMAREVEDDLCLTDATCSSIDGILTRFKKGKEDIYSIFEQVKEESNKVREQQRINYEAIQAVKAAYKQAYDEIMKKHREETDRIKGDMLKTKDGVKPKIKKLDEKE